MAEILKALNNFCDSWVNYRDTRFKIHHKFTNGFDATQDDLSMVVLWITSNFKGSVFLCLLANSPISCVKYKQSLTGHAGEVAEIMLVTGDLICARSTSDIKVNLYIFCILQFDYIYAYTYPYI